jgi:hypothetical protein
MGTWLDKSFRVFNLVLLQNFFEAQSLKITRGVDNCSFLNKQFGVVVCGDSLSPNFIVHSLLPETFPLNLYFFNLFLICGTRRYEIPP